MAKTYPARLYRVQEDGVYDLTLEQTRLRLPHSILQPSLLMVEGSNKSVSIPLDGGWKMEPGDLMVSTGPFHPKDKGEEKPYNVTLVLRGERAFFLPRGVRGSKLAKELKTSGPWSNWLQLVRKCAQAEAVEYLRGMETAPFAYPKRRVL